MKNYNDEDEGHVDMDFKPVSTDPRVEDVVGKPREFLEDMINSINGEAIYHTMGVETDKTFLLYGPPGTGKTMVMNALNNTMNIPFYEKCASMGKNPKDVLNLKYSDLQLCTFQYALGRHGTAYINRGSLKVQRFFDNAGSLAYRGVRVLIELDEADAVLSTRGYGHSEDRKVLETIMKNIQQAHDTPNMYVVMMTNLPEICDEAVLRAERVDKKYKFDLPNRDERIRAINVNVERINKKADYQVVRNYNAEYIADMTDGFNYADITSCINGAVKKRALEISRDRTDNIVTAGYISQNRLEEQIKQHKTSFNKDKKLIGY